MRIERNGLQYATVDEAARESHYSRAHVTSLAKRGKVRSFLVANFVYVDMNSLRNYCESQHGKLCVRRAKVKRRLYRVQ